MPDRLPVAGLYSNGGVARRIIKAEWHVIGWCSLRIHFPRYAVSRQHTWSAVLLLTTRPLTLSGIRSAFQHCFGNLNAPPLSPHSLFAEKGSCVGSCLSCPVASCSSEISPTHYHTLSPAYTVPVSSCLSAAAPGQRASSCRMLSPPPHNRLIWRRIGMRYDHPPLACPLSPSGLTPFPTPCPWC